MVTAVAPRHRAALDALELRAGHRVLEVGCGHGVLVTLLCELLDGEGSVHAIDRSSKMIEAAARRNEQHVRAGAARLQVTAMQHAELPPASFDRIVAVRVRELWADGDAMLPRLRGWLRPGGMLCAVFDAPDGSAGGHAESLSAAMVRHGFGNVVRQCGVNGAIAVVTGLA